MFNDLLFLGSQSSMFKMASRERADPATTQIDTILHEYERLHGTVDLGLGESLYFRLTLTARGAVRFMDMVLSGTDIRRLSPGR